MRNKKVFAILVISLVCHSSLSIAVKKDVYVDMVQAFLDTRLNDGGNVHHLLPNIVKYLSNEDRLNLSLVIDPSKKSDDAHTENVRELFRCLKEASEYSYRKNDVVRYFPIDLPHLPQKALNAHHLVIEGYDAFEFMGEEKLDLSNVGKLELSVKDIQGVDTLLECVNTNIKKKNLDLNIVDPFQEKEHLLFLMSKIKEGYFESLSFSVVASLENEFKDFIAQLEEIKGQDPLKRTFSLPQFDIFFGGKKIELPEPLQEDIRLWVMGDIPVIEFATPHSLNIKDVHAAYALSLAHGVFYIDEEQNEGHVKYFRKVLGYFRKATLKKILPIVPPYAYDLVQQLGHLPCSYYDSFNPLHIHTRSHISAHLNDLKISLQKIDHNSDSDLKRLDLFNQALYFYENCDEMMCLSSGECDRLCKDFRHILTFYRVCKYAPLRQVENAVVFAKAECAKLGANYPKHESGVTFAVLAGFLAKHNLAEQDVLCKLINKYIDDIQHHRIPGIQDSYIITTHMEARKLLQKPMLKAPEAFNDATDLRDFFKAT